MRTADQLTFDEFNQNPFTAVAAAGDAPPPAAATTPSPRHIEEAGRLHLRLDRNHGSWTTSHPRWRLLKAIYSYQRYGHGARAELQRWRGLYKNVPKAQQQRLLLLGHHDSSSSSSSSSSAGYRRVLNDIEHLISDRNAPVCAAVAAFAADYYGVDEATEVQQQLAEAEETIDRVSVVQALKHYVRDWADEGKGERDAAFPCLLGALEGAFPDRPGGGGGGGGNANASAPAVRVLLPGSGLGRLGHEVDGLGGFEVTLNEWSTYMILAYRYLAAQPTAPDSIVIHPFIDGHSHHATRADMMRAVSLPSEDATSILTPHPSSSGVLLVEGDFTTVFSPERHAYFDAIVTHFFIDTARNLVSYLETIHALLRPGGRWLNFGPLLYGTAPWVQLSLDEIVAVCEAIGFEFVELSAGSGEREGQEEGDAGNSCGVLTFPEADGNSALGKIRSKDAAYGFDPLELRWNAYVAQVWMAVKRNE